jgi:hypothetical protein
MCSLRIFFSFLAAGVLGVLVCTDVASAQMSAPEVVQNGKEVTLKSNSPEAITVECPEGTKVLGGGGGSDVFGATNFAVVWSAPITGQQKDGWSVGIVNRSLTAKKGNIFAYALCGKVK